MERYRLDNGIRIIYEYREGSITSFCIGFNAGALEENEFPYGTAHALEHMVFKGTHKRTEKEINRECDEVFGFNNAMTNYPYAVYYGTTLSLDFEKGLELYSDILMNPVLNENGFDEEINIIKEELKEWKDDIYKFCEDELLYNSFKQRRIKYPIIGTEQSINSIGLNNLRDFYHKFYVPDNCVISVVSSNGFDTVVKIIKKHMGKWQGKLGHIYEALYEDNIPETYVTQRDINGAKINLMFPLHSLNDREIKNIQVFNYVFGEGTSSILYDEIRTKNGFAYEVWSNIKRERGIRLFNVVLGTSVENVDKSLSIIEDIIKNMDYFSDVFAIDNMVKIEKSMKLKRMLRLEKSIQLCKDIVCYELMYNCAEDVYDEVQGISLLSNEDIKKTVIKVLHNPSIQIVRP